MQNTVKKVTVLALALCLVMSLAACGGGGGNASEPVSTGSPDEVTTIGEGEKSFSFEVVDNEGTVIQFVVNTDADTVGDALQENGLIQGEENAYGLYVKTVNGLTLDYDKDGMFWALYVDDEYANVGVDETPIDEDAVYSFRATEG